MKQTNATTSSSTDDAGHKWTLRYEESITDTTGLQLKSLKDFASHLGYFFNGTYFYFEYQKPLNGAPKSDKESVSLQTMQMWHNTLVLDPRGALTIQPTVYSREFTKKVLWEGYVDTKMWIAAMNSKIVRNTYLQLQKKPSKVIATKHLIQWDK